MKALWLHPISHAKCYAPPPSTHLYVLSDGVSYKGNPQTEAVQQVFSQLTGVGQGAHVLSAVVLAKLCGRSNTHRTQKTLKGKPVCGGGMEKGGRGKIGGLSYLLIIFLLCSKLPSAKQVYKIILTKPPSWWLAPLKAGELHGWQCMCPRFGE